MSELYLIDKPKSSFFTDLENVIDSILNLQVDDRFYVPNVYHNEIYYFDKNLDIIYGRNNDYPEKWDLVNNMSSISPIFDRFIKLTIDDCIKLFKKWIQNITEGSIGYWDFNKYCSLTTTKKIRSRIIMRHPYKERIRLNLQDMLAYNDNDTSTWMKILWDELKKHGILENNMPVQNSEKNQFSYSLLKYFFIYDLETDEKEIEYLVAEIVLTENTSYYGLLNLVEEYFIKTGKYRIYWYEANFNNFSAKVIDSSKLPPIDFFNSEIKPVLEKISLYIINGDSDLILKDQELKEFFHSDLLKILAFIANPIKFLEMF